MKASRQPPLSVCPSPLLWVGKGVRRLLPLLLFILCVPLALVAAFQGQAQAGPRSQLVKSWVDSGGAAHLSFDVSGVRARAILTSRLVLHRQPDAPATGVKVSASDSGWSRLAGWVTAAPSSESARSTTELASTVITLDVSEVVHSNGPVSFIVSDAADTADPNVITSADAGDAAPSLVIDVAPAGSPSDDSQTAASSPSATSALASAEGSASGEPTPSTPQPSLEPTPSTAPTPDGSASPTQSATPVPTDLVDPPSDVVPAPTPSPGQPACSVSSILVPSCGTWWGVGAVPATGESWDQALVDFDTQQARSSDLLHYYHVGAVTFPTQLEIARATADGQNRVLLENWKPELGRTWAQVAAGDPVVDSAIDREAAYLVSDYTAPFFLAIHHEPENEIIATPGSGYTATDYAAMYRHVVLRLRADGVTNAVYVMDYMGAPKWGEQAWFGDLYPGDDVVDWIAEDPYSIGSGGVWRADFAGTVNRQDGSAWPGFYTWATATHPGKPIMLAEWGVTEDPLNPAAKATFFDTMLAQSALFPDIKALVYWNSPGSSPAGATSIDSDPAALAAFQRLAGSSEYHVALP
jgi:hypothetical protein